MVDMADRFPHWQPGAVEELPMEQLLMYATDGKAFDTEIGEENIMWVSPDEAAAYRKA